MNEQEQRVQAGLAWLDENFPGWVGKVDVERIDDRFYGQGVLGQVAGPDGYLQIADQFRQQYPRDERGRFLNEPGSYRLYDLGFTDVVHPREINAAWKEAVSKRQGK